MRITRLLIRDVLVDWTVLAVFTPARAAAAPCGTTAAAAALAYPGSKQKSSMHVRELVALKSRRREGMGNSASMVWIVLLGRQFSISTYSPIELST